MTAAAALVSLSILCTVVLLVTQLLYHPLHIQEVPQSHKLILYRNVMCARQDIKHMSDSSRTITPSYNIIRQQITSDSFCLRQREQINELLCLFKEEENELSTSYVTLGKKILSWDLIKAAALGFQTLSDQKCSCCCPFMILTCGTTFNNSPNFFFFFHRWLKGNEKNN